MLESLEQVGDFCKSKIPELGGFVVPLAVAKFCWASTFPSDDLLEVPQPGPSQMEEASGKKKKNKNGIACPMCLQVFD